MAKSSVRLTEKTRMVEEKYTEKDGITLELTQEEAEFLGAVLGMKIVGNGHGRLVNAAIFAELYRHGFDYYISDAVKKHVAKMSGSITILRED